MDVDFVGIFFLFFFFLPAEKNTCVQRPKLSREWENEEESEGGVHSMDPSVAGTE